MAKRQQALPYIYGYKTRLNEISREIKVLTRETEQEVLDLLSRYSEVIDFNVKYKFEYDFESLATEEGNSIRDQLYTLILLILLFRQGSFHNISLLALYNGFATGVLDGKFKLIGAIKKYKGKHSELKKELIDRVRTGNLDIPIGVRLEYRQVADKESIKYLELFALSLATNATRTITSSLSEEEKQAKIRKEVKEEYKSNKRANTFSKLLLWVSVHKGLEIYTRRRPISVHEWVVDNPQDTPCIISAGEIVPVGQPFSNGFKWGGTVHLYCHCSTVAAILNSSQFENILKYYGIKY